MKPKQSWNRYRTGIAAAFILGLSGVLPNRAAAQQPASSPTLDAVKKRGELICGIDTGIPGYAYQDSAGKWQGLDVALCRAIAVAVLGDSDKVKFIGLTSKVRFTVLASGEIDVLIRDSEVTLARNANLGLAKALMSRTPKNSTARRSAWRPAPRSR
jgi:general L-amino acid transport system substrate-binding protein